MTQRIAAWLAMLLLILAPAIFAQEDSDLRLLKAQRDFAEKGDAAAQYFLGEMYEQGLGTDQNLAEAFRWYEKSAKQGNRQAQQKLSRRQAIEQQHAQERAGQEAAGPAPGTQGQRPATTQRETVANERARKRAEIRAMILNRSRTHREAFE